MNKYIIRFNSDYPKAEYQDYIKMIYQANFCGGHLINDINSAYNFLLNEYSIISSNERYLYEYLSDNVVRINLGLYKKNYLDIDYLFNSFINSANSNRGKKEDYLKDVEDFNSYCMNLGIEKVNIDLDEVYSHTTNYRKEYLPHYRVLNSNYITNNMRFINLENYILKGPKKRIIAIDGRSCSLKSSIVGMLEKKHDITVIHVDDFFLEDEMKTKERLEEVGGNFNYERLEEILKKIKPNKKFKYQKYNCMTKSYETVDIKKVSNIIIVEGVYSYHETLRKYYTDLVFFKVLPEEQLERLKKRVDEKIYNKFITEWLPLEDKYFENDNIEKSANILI